MPSHKTLEDLPPKTAIVVAKSVIDGTPPDKIDSAGGVISLFASGAPSGKPQDAQVWSLEEVLEKYPDSKTLRI